MKYNRVSVNVGYYDFCHPSKKQIGLYFHWRIDAPDEVKKCHSLVVWNEGDGPEGFDSSVEAMRGAVLYMKRCLFHSDKDKAMNALLYLESVEDQDYRDSLLAERERLAERIAKIDVTLKPHGFVNAVC